MHQGIDEWFDNPRREDYNMTNRIYRWKLFRRGLRCSICPPHRGENYGMNGRKIRRSWKKYRKTQYKNK